MKFSAVSSVPPKNPLRRMAPAMVNNATAPPIHGQERMRRRVTSLLPTGPAKLRNAMLKKEQSLSQPLARRTYSSATPAPKTPDPQTPNSPPPRDNPVEEPPAPESPMRDPPDPEPPQEDPPVKDP